MTNLYVEEVFRTEGVPEFTFVEPPNFNEIFVDVRTKGKPVIIEGQSGTGKTTVIKKIIGKILTKEEFSYLSARNTQDIITIIEIANEKKNGHFVIDDFHRLPSLYQEKIGNLVKLAAEYTSNIYPKIVIIGINEVGSELIHLVHDVAKRCGIHRIQSAPLETISQLITKGEKKLNITIADHQKVFEDTGGDYWLTQLYCQSICLSYEITETAVNPRKLPFDQAALRKKVTERLESSYKEPVKEFCRGTRFRPTNNPYYKLLHAISKQESSIVDLTELANANADVRGSINNIKETRLSNLIASKLICERYFYYSPETKRFAIEDPALFFYLKNLDWDELRKACGFRSGAIDYPFDFAISFAGENRALAKEIAAQLGIMDCSVFFDEYFEANYLGSTWHKKFLEIFGTECRFVICLLDIHHLEKVWPTFEREVFSPRVKDEAVIPIFMDETVFVGIPKSIVGIPFKDKVDPENATFKNTVTDKITFKLMAKLEQA